MLCWWEELAARGQVCPVGEQGNKMLRFYKGKTMWENLISQCSSIKFSSDIKIKGSQGFISGMVPLYLV